MWRSLGFEAGEPICLAADFHGYPQSTAKGAHVARRSPQRQIGPALDLRYGRLIQFELPGDLGLAQAQPRSKFTELQIPQHTRAERIGFGKHGRRPSTADFVIVDCHPIPSNSKTIGYMNCAVYFQMSVMAGPR
jgi:hypothetical protein